MTPSPDKFCPYKGLQPYTEADRKFFFGRTRDQGIIISNLYAASLTVFYGASGVGKSSVLLAGVVPRIKEEPRTAVVVVFNKWQSEDFLSALKTEVTKQAGAATSVDPALPLDEFLAATQRAVDLPMFLICDQFEEYFLYHPVSPAADAFEAEFARAVNRRAVQVNILLSLREDGLSKLDRFQGRIPSLLNNLLRLEHLDRSAAEEAITKPLDEYNLENSSEAPITIEPSLVKAVLDDLTTGKVAPEHAGQGQVSESQVGAVVPIETPFLQMVLTRLWDEETGKNSRVLRLRTYDGLGRALNIARTHLDNMMAKLTEPQRETAAKLLRYLVTPAGSKIAQEPGALASWSDVPEDEVEAFLNRLTAQDMRILRTIQTPGQPLRFEIFHDVMAPAILDWRGRYMLEQKRLEDEKTALEERARAAEQLAQQRRKARRARWIAVGSLLLLLVMGVLAWKAYQAKFRARSHELAAYAKSQLEIDPELSLLLAIEAVKVKRTPHALEALKSSLVESQVGAVVGARNGGRIAGLAFSPDNKYLVTASWNSTAQIWETATGKSVSVLKGNKGHLNAASFSPDEKYVLTAGEDGMVRIWQGWQTATPTVFKTLPHAGEITTAGFSQSGEYVLTGSGDGMVRVWDWKSSPPAIKAELPVTNATFADPRPTPETTNPPSVATSGALQPGAETAPLPAPEASPSPGSDLTPTFKGLFLFKAEFSPDGNLIMIAAKHRRALIWNWTEGPNSLIKLSGHTFSLYDVAFSRDGKYAITGSDDATAIVWELRTPGGPTSRMKINLVPHRIRGVAFSQDGRFVATASYDGLARIWEWRLWEPKLRDKQKPEERSKPIVLRGHSGLLMCVAFSPDGQFLATGSDDGTARIWRTAKLQEAEVNNMSPDDLLKLASQRVTRQLTADEKKKYMDQ